MTRAGNEVNYHVTCWLAIGSTVEKSVGQQKNNEPVAGKRGT